VVMKMISFVREICSETTTNDLPGAGARCPV